MKDLKTWQVPSASELWGYLQYLILGIVGLYAYAVLVFAYVLIIGSFLYAFVYMPLAWAISHTIGLVGS